MIKIFTKNLQGKMQAQESLIRVLKIQLEACKKSNITLNEKLNKRSSGEAPSIELLQNIQGDKNAKT